MRNIVVSLLLLSLLNPFLTSSVLEDEKLVLQSSHGGVEVIDEVEPNNVNTSGQEMYPGDVVRGTVDMWSDKVDWYSIWLEPGQTLLLTLSHASGDGVSMSVWDENNTHLGFSNPAKARDTIFLDEEETDLGGVYSVSINATMTEAGGGAYVLEIDAGYEVNWYSSAAGWYVASDIYDAKGNIMYTSELSSFQFAESASTDTQSAPVWTNGDFWNFSISMPEFIDGISYEEYHQMTVTGTDTVSGKDCYRVSIEGKATLAIELGGVETKTIDEQSGVACYAKDTLSLIHENLTMTTKLETSGFGSMSQDQGRSCTDDWGDPDEDCDGVADDWDDCPGTALGDEVDAWGCSDAQNNGGGTGNDDADNDGIPDSSDACPNDYADSSNDADGDGCPDNNGGGGNGSGTGSTDSDNDGVIDDDDMCPDTTAGDNVDFFGCSDEQNGNSGGGGNGGGNGSGTGGGGSGLGCIPTGADQSTIIKSDLVYSNGINDLNFPLTEGKVWSEAAIGTGTMSLSIEMGGCSILDMELDGSDALPLNYRHIGDKSFTIGGTTVTATGIQSFAGREGNNDWATPDFTILPSVPDDVARMGLPFAAWINVVGFNEFNSTVDISATVNAQSAPLMYDNQQLTIDDLGAVVVDTMNLSSGEYELTIIGTSGGNERSVIVPFTVDNDPDFEIVTMDPWIVLPGGVPWVVPTPIFVEPVNGFGADVTLSAVVPDGVTAELDFARGSAPFMAVLTLTISDDLPEGDYTVIISGTSGSTVHSDEITFSITSLPEFSLDIENREQQLAEGSMSISGVINAHNGLDLTLGGVLDVLVEPYNQDLLDSAVISWGEIDSNGDLPFTVTFTVDENTPMNEYTIQLNVVTLDGGVSHAASIAFVTESSTLDGTAVAADASSVVSGNTTQHDGSDTSASDLSSDTGDNNEDANDETKDSEDSESESSNTALIVGSTIGVVGILVGVAVVLMRGRNSETTIGEQMAVESEMSFAEPNPVVQEQFVVPVAQQMQTAPPPPAQPSTVADYTGLPPGGTYDQSTGQTVYVQADGVRWQMMPDGSFNRLS